MKAPRIALSLTWLLNLSRSLLRRLLYIWIKSTVVPKDLNPYLTGNRGSSSKVCYVLRAKWFIDAAILEHHCVQEGIARAFGHDRNAPTANILYIDRLGLFQKKKSKIAVRLSKISEVHSRLFR